MTMTMDERDRQLLAKLEKHNNESLAFAAGIRDGYRYSAAEQVALACQFLDLALKIKLRSEEAQVEASTSRRDR